MEKIYKKTNKKIGEKFIILAHSEDSNLSENIFEPLSSTMGQNIAKFE
jgi:hypothetical protein